MTPGRTRCRRSCSSTTWRSCCAARRRPSSGGALYGNRRRVRGRRRSAPALSSGTAGGRGRGRSGRSGAAADGRGGRAPRRAEERRHARRYPRRDPQQGRRAPMAGPRACSLESGRAGQGGVGQRQHPFGMQVARHRPPEVPAAHLRPNRPSSSRSLRPGPAETSTPCSTSSCSSGTGRTAPTRRASASQSPMPSPIDARTPRTILPCPAARCSASPHSLPASLHRRRPSSEGVPPVVESRQRQTHITPPSAIRQGRHSLRRGAPSASRDAHSP